MVNNCFGCGAKDSSILAGPDWHTGVIFPGAANRATFCLKGRQGRFLLPKRCGEAEKPDERAMRNWMSQRAEPAVIGPEFARFGV
jgi:hypothetical protein